MSAVTAETPTDHAISVTNLRKSYGELEAVRGIAPSPPCLSQAGFPSPSEGEGRLVVGVARGIPSWGEGELTK